MLMLRDPAAGIHDGTSLMLWGAPSRDESCKDPVGATGVRMLQELCEWGRKRPPQAPEVASSPLEKWEKALQHKIHLWMRRDVLDMVG